MRTYNLPAGGTIYDHARNAIKLAEKHGEDVSFTMNDIEIEVSGGSCPIDIATISNVKSNN